MHLPGRPKELRELLTDATCRRFGNRRNPRGSIYRWSDWGADALRTQLREGSSPERLIQVGLRHATNALRRCGAFSRASDAAPIQPRFCDVVDLELLIGGQMHGVVVCPLRRMGEALADFCHGTGLLPILWKGSCSSLSHPGFAYRILTQGAAALLRADCFDELKILLRGHDPFPLLEAAIGSTHGALLAALKRGHSGNFGGDQQIRRRRQPIAC